MTHLPRPELTRVCLRAPCQAGRSLESIVDGLAAQGIYLPDPPQAAVSDYLGPCRLGPKLGAADKQAAGSKPKAGAPACPPTTPLLSLQILRQWLIPIHGLRMCYLRGRVRPRRHPVGAGGKAANRPQAAAGRPTDEHYPQPSMAQARQALLASCVLPLAAPGIWSRRAGPGACAVARTRAATAGSRRHPQAPCSSELAGLARTAAIVAWHSQPRPPKPLPGSTAQPGCWSMAPPAPASACCAPPPRARRARRCSTSVPPPPMESSPGRMWHSWCSW